MAQLLNEITSFYMELRIKIFFFFILPILISISCAPKRTAENDWTEMGLKGRVNLLEIEEYSAKYKFGVLEKEEYSEKMYPDLPDKYFIFNEKGRIIEEFHQYSNSEEKIAKAYDEYGNLTRENTLKYYEGKYQKYFVRYVNKYDTNKNLIEITKYKGDSIIEKKIATFNKNRDKIVENEYFGTGTRSGSIKYKYNIWGQLKAKIHEYGSIEKYNKHRQHIETIFKANDGTEKTIWEYDHNGNVTNGIQTKNKDYYHNRYQYDYDSYNNVIKKIRFNKRDKKSDFDPESMEIIEISYFNNGKNTDDQVSLGGNKRDRLNLFPVDWKVVSIPNIGSIAIPPDMEIRDDSSLISIKSADFHKSFTSNTKIEMEKPLLVIQPVGINNQTKNENYARIIINVTNGQSGDFPKNDTELNTIELSELNTIRKEQTQFFVKKFGGEIINWNPPINLNINGLNMIVLNYIRAKVSSNKENDPVGFLFQKKSISLDNAKKWGEEMHYQSIVKVSDYIVFNANKMINITISYRIPDICQFEPYFPYSSPNEKTKQNIDLDFLINTLDVKN